MDWKIIPILIVIIWLATVAVLGSRPGTGDRLTFPGAEAAVQAPEPGRLHERGTR